MGEVSAGSFFFTIGTNDITHLTNPNFNSSHPKRKESFSRQQLVCILNICDIVLSSRGGGDFEKNSTIWEYVALFVQTTPQGASCSGKL